MSQRGRSVLDDSLKLIGKEASDLEEEGIKSLRLFRNHTVLRVIMRALNIGA